MELHVMCSEQASVGALKGDDGRRVDPLTMTLARTPVSFHLITLHYL
jgi:hypothetical protein